MQCPNCNTENRESRRFCSSCGAELIAGCPVCNFVNDLEDEFCGGCGVKLSEASANNVDQSDPEQPEEKSTGDRRQLTIFFADLTGYTELSDALDAEDLHQLTGLVLDTIDRIVEDHGGTVHRHVGDEVMALFGAPIAHTDDPMRAVRAAFATHEAMISLGAEQGRLLKVHIGIASGNVVIAEQGMENPEDVPEYAITGAAANLAARLNSMSDPGETVVSNSVYQAIEEQVDCDTLGETNVKGFEKPVLAWRAKALRVQNRKRSQIPLIGRRAEIAQLNGALDSCGETGNGQAVLIRGEAGIGKTRLVEDFESTAEKHGFACHKGRIFDFGVGEGQDAIRTLVYSLLGVPSENDIPVREAAALAALTNELCKPDQCVFLNDLLNLPQPAELQGIYEAMDNATRHHGKHALLSSLIQNASGSQPRLFVVEDVHWADAEALSDLALITVAVQDSPVLLVMTSRIEGDPLDKTWRGSAGGSPLLTIDIGPLREAEAAELAGTFASAIDDFAKNCIERAGGNPLFLEQLLRSAEVSRDEEVPATIQSLVLMRMDRLTGPDKRALQAASAIGQQFALDILQSLVSDPAYSCDQLIEHHLVRPDGDDYLFAHALIQEGVYASLLKDSRIELHKNAADWFLERDPALHAEHLDRADAPNAPQAYLRAAHSKASDYHYNQALRLVSRGLAIAKELGDLFGLSIFQAGVLLDLGSIDDSIKGYQSALEYADDDIGRFQAWLGLAGGMRIADRYDDALDILEKAEAVARRQNLISERAKVHHFRGNLYFPMGRIEECALEHEKSLKFAQESGSSEAEVNSLSGLADASYVAGRMNTAFQYFSRCVEVARQCDFTKIEVPNRSMVGFSRMYLNQISEALEDALETIAAAKKVGHQRAEMLGEILAAYAFFEMEVYDKSHQHNARAIELARGLGASRFEAQSLFYKGKLERVEGKVDDAIKTLETALAISEEVGHGFAGPRIVSEIARNPTEIKAKTEALAEGMRMLAAGSVSHNHFVFYENAIEVSFDIADWGGAERFASDLEDFTKAEPLPWSNFIIARGRALAAYGRGQRDSAINEELQRLSKIAQQASLKTAAHQIDAALETMR